MTCRVRVNETGFLETLTWLLKALVRTDSYYAPTQTCNWRTENSAGGHDLGQAATPRPCCSDGRRVLPRARRKLSSEAGQRVLSNRREPRWLVQVVGA